MSLYLLIKESEKRERENGLRERCKRRCARAEAHLHIRVGGLTRGYTLRDTWRSSIVYNVIVFRDIRSVCERGREKEGRGKEGEGKRASRKEGSARLNAPGNAKGASSTMQLTSRIDKIGTVDVTIVLCWNVLGTWTWSRSNATGRLNFRRWKWLMQRDFTYLKTR